MNKTIDTIFYVLQFGTFAIALAFSVWIFIRTRSYVRLILAAWGAIFAWSVLNCMVFPLVFHWAGVERVFDYVPEMTGVAACGLAGWIFGIELAIIILVGSLISTGLSRLFRKAKTEA